MTSRRVSRLVRSATFLLVLGVAGCGQDHPDSTTGAGGTGGGVGGTGGCAGDGCTDSSIDASIEADGGTDAPSLDRGDSGDESDAGDAGDLDAETSDEPPVQDAPQETDAGDEADVNDPGDSSGVPDVADGRDDNDEVRPVSDGGVDADGGAAPLWASGPPYWLPGVPLTVGRVNLGGAFVSTGLKKGKIVAVGGTLAVPDTYESFDGTTWTTDAMPSMVYECTATGGADGKVYAFVSHLTDGWVLDGSWTALPPRPRATAYPSAATGSDGLIYVGATQGNTTYLDVYAPLLGRWSTVAKPKPRSTFAPVLVSRGSKIYVVGGDGVRPRAFEAYDVDTAIWSSLADLPTPTLPAMAAGGDGRIYATGGIPGAAATNAVFAYDPATDRWDSVAPLIAARQQHAAVLGADGRIYAFGGMDGKGLLKSVEAYGPVVALTKTQAPPGTVVVVTGNNFAANANVSLYLGPVRGAPLGTGKTNGTGGLAPSIVFKVPIDAAAGETYVSVVDDRSRFPVAIPFTVEAAP